MAPQDEELLNLVWVVSVVLVVWLRCSKCQHLVGMKTAKIEFFGATAGCVYRSLLLLVPQVAGWQRRVPVGAVLMVFEVLLVVQLLVVVVEVGVSSPLGVLVC